ncbi:hypothetical protein J4573_02395 [Actinomadura barringtoniae]|uniref:Uncharacterized protein n=1 Tax=Actinomadura barringtoniae TaxID=1427535 RepID=A0A939T2Z0_9ACTN|nr:hypothetical protein [Actinomadura barringtoniae]MBO2445929.1 hypothetical protein [Actinomadura barringtoniae]
MSKVIAGAAHLTARLSDRMLGLVVPRISASASAVARCPWGGPQCSGRCYCVECARGFAKACCLTGGGTESCEPCVNGC